MSKLDTATVSQNLKYLTLLSKEYPSRVKASSEIINLQALLKLPKGTEHYLSDLHGEDEAFTHLLNSASGVIREKVDAVLGERVSAHMRATLSTLIYYPNEKLSECKASFNSPYDLEDWYRTTLFHLIDVCRLVSSKHTREYVRECLPQSCGYILDELLHAHFEDHNKTQYYGQIVGSILENDTADMFIVRLCQLIKRLAVDKLHIVGDLFDRGPRPDIILSRLINHHNVDVQWGNHDTVWMGAAAGSEICICTVIKTTLSYYNHGMLEDHYGISLRHLLRFAERWYGSSNLKRWMPHTNISKENITPEGLRMAAAMHKAITIMMFKLECQVIDRNPDFDMQGRDYLRHINWKRKTVVCNGVEHPLMDSVFPTVDTENPEKFFEEEKAVIAQLVRSFTHSEKLQKQVAFLYAKGSVYHIENGNLLYHGAIPMTQEGEFAKETFEGQEYYGKNLLAYCEKRARQGYFAPKDSPERVAGQDFLWYLWCGKLSPIFGRSAMTTFERLYIEDKTTHEEIKDPYYKWYDDEKTCIKILNEFGLDDTCHIVNGHVPVQEKKGESPIKGGGRLLVIDGGFCSAYHEKTGIAGYTLVYSSHGMSLRTHQPFHSRKTAIAQNEDILSRVNIFSGVKGRVLVENTDDGKELKARIEDLKQLVFAYQRGLLKEETVKEHIW